MCARRMLGSAGLACLLSVTAVALSTGRLFADYPTDVSGGISADNGHFEPIAQEGSVVTFLHVDTHELTGDIQGSWSEVGYLTLDLITGEGFFIGVGEFTGTVLGESGKATLKVHGEVRDFLFSDRGHFVITRGEGGLAGVHAWGTYDIIVGVGGNYTGLADLDERP